MIFSRPAARSLLRLRRVVALVMFARVNTVKRRQRAEMTELNESGKLRPEVPIHAVFQGCVEAHLARLDGRPADHHHCRNRDNRRAQHQRFEDVACELAWTVISKSHQGALLFIAEVAIRKDYVGFRMSLKIGHEVRQRSRQVKIVCIQEADVRFHEQYRVRCCARRPPPCSPAGS